jgi:hypothetical protein
MSKSENGNQEAPGQNKSFKIFVNTREKTFNGKEISFREVVVLAYPDAVFSEEWSYIVTYSKGEDKDPKGTMVDNGKNVHVKDGMAFDVERNNRS